MPSGLPPPVLIAVVERRKAWYRSKVLWFNCGALALAAAEAHMQLLQGLLPGQLYQWLAFVLPVANAGLRVFTRMGVALTAAPEGVSPQGGGAS